MKYYFKCPKCGNDQTFFKVKQQSEPWKWVMFLLGYWIIAALLEDSMMRRIQCSQCSYIFKQPPLPETAISRVASWNILLVILFILVLTVAFSFPALQLSIPQLPIVNQIEQAMINNTKIISVSIMALLILLFLPSIVISFISNFILHVKMKKQFKTKPEEHNKVKKVKK